jgi:hypothetical protein
MAKIRAGAWKPRRSAEAARKHLRRLSRFGIGIRTVSEVTGIATSTLLGYKTERRRHISETNETLILNVTRDARIDRTRVDARRTRRMVKALLIEGFTRQELAKRMGRSQFQIARKPCVFAQTEMLVEKLHRKYVEAA